MSATDSGAAPAPPPTRELQGGPPPLPGRERRRLALALALSLLFHALLASLTFGGEGVGLPGFSLPWRERRIEAP
ncbi:MAG TPA: hypothetical protein P5024_13225, partial [Burkholderiaceae bacterium]|nr:hypothetical protein [Burkholderiaceae bacterium]